MGETDVNKYRNVLRTKVDVSAGYSDFWLG